MKAFERGFPTRRLAGGILAIFGAAACGGNDPAPKTPDTDEAPAAAEPALSPYAIFPEDAEILVGASLAGIRDSAMWELYGDLIVGGVDTGGVLDDARQACGFDPLDEAEGVRFGGSTAKPEEMILVVDGISRAQLRACFDGAAAIRGNELAVSGEGSVVTYQLDDYELLVGWIDEDTFAVGPESHGDEAWLERRLAGEDGLRDDAPLVQLVASRADGEPGLWLGAIPGQGSPMRSNLAASGAPVPRSLAASVTPTDVLDLDLVLRFESADVAAQVRDQTMQMLQMVKLQIGDLGRVIDKLELNSDSDRLVARLALTQDDLAAVASQFGGVFGDSTTAAANEDTTQPAQPAPGVRPPTADDLADYTEDLEGQGPLMATLETSEGSIRCRLFEKKVPVTVANFVGLARGLKRWQDPTTGEGKDEPLYDGTIFHRVIPEFMIQGGDPMGDGRGGPGYRFDNEIVDGIAHDAPGTLAMANAGPDTNGSQFYITEAPQPRLDGDYTVFGRCQNLDVIQKIARVQTARADKPVDDVVLETVTISRGRR